MTIKECRESNSGTPSTDAIATIMAITLVGMYCTFLVISVGIDWTALPTNLHIMLYVLLILASVGAGKAPTAGCPKVTEMQDRCPRYVAANKIELTKALCSCNGDEEAHIDACEGEDHESSVMSRTAAEAMVHGNREFYAMGFEWQDGQWSFQAGRLKNYTRLN
jgi:hypothetical protein